MFESIKKLPGFYHKGDRVQAVVCKSLYVSQKCFSIKELHTLSASPAIRHR